MFQSLCCSPKRDPVGFPAVCLTKTVTKISNRVQYGAGGTIRHLLANSEVENVCVDFILFADFVGSI